MAQTLGSVQAGTIVKLNVNRNPTNFIVVQQGLPSSGLYDASCDGTWVLEESCYNAQQWNSTRSNDYANSTINAWLNNGFVALLDPDIQTAVKQVKIPYRPGAGMGTTVNSGANGLAVKAFLLSMREIGLYMSGASPNEGATLSYFSSGGSANRIAQFNNSPVNWMSRSPYLSDQERACITDLSGALGFVYCDFSGYYVRPAMILPSTLLINDNGFVVTNQPPTAPGSIDVTAVVSGGEATITLTAATDPDGTVESYIYERSVDGGQWTQFANVNALTQTDAISEDWGTVAYRAAAVDNNDTQGPYITSDTEAVNTGWLLIGGPTSNMGVQSLPFDLALTIGVSGQTGVTGINVVVKMDGVQLYDDSVDQSDTVTIPIDTRTMGSGQHEIQVTASKEDYLNAIAAYYFTVPSIALPAGGYSQQLEDSSGNPIFPLTTARYVVGANGKSVQAEIDQINASHRGTTGHLAFLDALLGSVSGYELAREENTTYVVHIYPPANVVTSAAIYCIYPGYTGTVSSYDTNINVSASGFSITVQSNWIVSIYQYVLDSTPPAETDPTVNFTALAQPKVVTAATNTGNAATDLNAALEAMMDAFPSQNYYAIVDAQNASTTYYVAAQATISQNTTSASVAYVSSAAPTVWYQGVQMTFINTSNIASLFTYLNPPAVASITSANSVSAGSTLNDTLIAMIKAQPSYYRYQLEDNDGTLYYVLSSAQLTTDSLTASNVLYCTTGGTYYNGESITFVPAEFPDPASLTLGNTINWAGQNWIVSNVDSTECYLTLSGLSGESVYDAGGSAVYAGSDLANTAMNFQTQKFTAAQLACLKDVTVNGVTSKVFVASKDQMNGGFDYFNSNSRRNLNKTYWTSTPYASNNAWFIYLDGSVGASDFLANVSLGFRPSVCLDLSLLG